MYLRHAMNRERLIRTILNNFALSPTTEQASAIEIFADFLYDKNPRSTMILRGCAGTGKTTLAGAIVKALDELSYNTCLLAPTGRAAKVFSHYSDSQALTIHRRIYKKASDKNGIVHFTLDFNKAKNTLFIVDEASMISNREESREQYADADLQYGSGCLLDDLIRYVYDNGYRCKILFMGDKAQLPPVGEAESYALSADTFLGYGLEPYQHDLNEVLRQSEDSGILWNATRIRQKGSSDLICSPTPYIPKIKINGFADVVCVAGNELIESIDTSYREVGIDETMVVTRSNKRANIYNEGIRRTILDRDARINSGDSLMVVKNNYFWVEKDEGCPLAFIANGDRVIVKRFRNEHTLYGFTFANVTIEFPDYNNYEMTALMLLDTLNTEAPALTPEQSNELYRQILEDYTMQPDCPHDRKKLLAQVRDDMHYNAIQIKYGYAVTCHKAQGGQWCHIYIDQGYLPKENMNEDYVHWLYTAITRATEKVFLVNWDETQIEA